MPNKREQNTSPEESRPAAADHPIGPTSIQGVEASDFPDERGSVDTDPRRIRARKLPLHTGGQIGGDVGQRAMPGAAEAEDHGGRKGN